MPLPLFKGFKAAEWPDTDPKPPGVDRLLADNKRAWAQVRRMEGALWQLATLEGGGALAKHVLLVAWRATRGIGVAGKAMKAYEFLGTLAPYQWQKLIELPGVSNITMTPETCSPAEFAKALGVVLPYLACPPGTPANYVVQWILEEGRDRVLDIWPQAEELIRFENMVLAEARGILSNRGRVPMERFFTGRLGMAPSEARDLIKAVMCAYADLGKLDPDVERGILLERAERFYERARKNNQLREEGNAIKLHAQLVGLTREIPTKDGEDDVDLLEVIKAVNAIEGPPKKQVPEAPNE